MKNSIDRIERELQKPLDAGRVKEREGYGGEKLAYLPGHDVIRDSNDAFGPLGWSSEVVRGPDLVHLREFKTSSGKTMYAATAAAVARVAVLGLDVDPVRGDVGTGTGIQKDPNAAIELAFKTAATDAKKRALKDFGDRFGLALYDEDTSWASGRIVPAGDPRLDTAPQERESRPPETHQTYKDVDPPDFLTGNAPLHRAATSEDVEELFRYLVEIGATDREIHATVAAGAIPPNLASFVCGVLKGRIDGDTIRPANIEQNVRDYAEVENLSSELPKIAAQNSSQFPEPSSATVGIVFDLLAWGRTLESLQNWGLDAYDAVAIRNKGDE